MVGGGPLALEGTSTVGQEYDHEGGSERLQVGDEFDGTMTVHHLDGVDEHERHGPLDGTLFSW